MDTSPPPPSTVPAASRLGSLILRCLGYIALWLIAACVFATLWYAFDLLRGRVWRVEDYLRWSLVQWSTLGVLGPIALWSAARNPIEPPHRLYRFFIHLFASIGFTVLAIFTGTLLSLFVEPGNPELGDQLEQFVTKHGEAGFLAYWVLVMVSQTTHLYREKSRRELQASRLQAQLAQSRLQVLKTQLQPHFLFNTLHASATLIRDDPDAAEEMLLSLSDLLRAFLEDHEGQEISLRRELRLLDLYLGIQRTRFKDRLTTKVTIAPDTLDCAVPSLILQPLVENAIAHGIGKHVGEDRIEIESFRDADNLCIEVRNRNSSLSPVPQGNARRGIGLSNSRLRLQELYGDAAEIRLDALQPRGVACRIRLPFRVLDPRAAPFAGKAA